MMQFVQLPTDVLLLIFEQLDVPSLFTLRLTSTYLNTTVATALNFVTPAVTRNTHTPTTRLLFEALDDSFSLRWLQNLLYR